MAYLLFHNFRFPQHHLVAQVVFREVMAFRAEVPPGLMVVRRFLSASSVSADSLLYHFGMEGSRPYDFCKPLPGVFPSQPSPSDAQENELLASSFLFSDFGGSFLNKLLCFLYGGARKPAFGHFCHIQGKAHVGLFQLYPTSLPRHSSRHVENLQEISCCF
jgi:hypothetical protein